MKIGFIGTGKLGKDCAEVIADRGYYVEGYDVVKCSPSNFSMVENIESLVSDKDIIFIAVPTGHDKEYGGEKPSSHLEPKDFNYDIVKSTLSEVNKYITDEQLVVLISTVLPGTVRRELAPLLDRGELIYNPYLIAMGSVKWDMVNPEMVIIGSEEGSINNRRVEKLISFYQNVLDNANRYVVGTWEEAESIKIFYNTFISAKIGLVNMIQDVAEKLGNMSVDVVTKALADSTQRIMGPKYMIAGGPDAGACHPRDNIALRKLAQDLDLGYDLFGSIMQAREVQTKNIATRAVELSEDRPIVIVGKAYKPGVHYLEGSGSLLVAHYLEELGKEYYYLDKYTDDTPPDHIISQPCLYILMHDAEITYCDSPMKDQVSKQEISPAQNSIILDMWRKQQDIDGCVVIKYGDTRNG